LLAKTARRLAATCAMRTLAYDRVSISEQAAENRLLALANAGYKSNLSCNANSAPDQKAIRSADGLKRRQIDVPRFYVSWGANESLSALARLCGVSRARVLDSETNNN
jgi:hypothetical protein